MAFLPSATEVQDILDADGLKILFEKVGIPTPADGPDTSPPGNLLLALGSPATLLDIALIPTDTYLAAAHAIRPPLPGVTLGKCVQALKWARFSLGMIPDTGEYGLPQNTLAPATQPMTKAAPPVKDSSQDGGTKMSSIVDESMDRMVTMVSQESINLMYADYLQAFGCYPSES